MQSHSYTPIKLQLQQLCHTRRTNQFLINLSSNTGQNQTPKKHKEQLLNVRTCNTTVGWLSELQHVANLQVRSECTGMYRVYIVLWDFMTGAQQDWHVIWFPAKSTTSNWPSRSDVKCGPRISQVLCLDKMTSKKQVRVSTAQRYVTGSRSTSGVD